jgi:S-adenosylmethionine hydrolase
VGPDNGLLVPAARTLDPSAQWHRIAWRPDALSASFHGRDLFAPTAARLVQGDCSGLKPLEAVPDGSTWPAEEAAVIYIDGYGNVMTGLRPQSGKVLAAGNQQFRERRTFSDAARGEAFWYKNALGLAEIAINQGNAASRLELAIGDAVSWL